jgi:hypothetical protein
LLADGVRRVELLVSCGNAAGDAGSGNACTAAPCPVVLASGQNNPQSIVVDSTDVYWVNFDPDCKLGAVMKVPLDSGTPTAIVSGHYCAGEIAIDSTNVYC